MRPLNYIRASCRICAKVFSLRRRSNRCSCGVAATLCCIKPPHLRHSETGSHSSDSTLNVYPVGLTSGLTFGVIIWVLGRELLNSRVYPTYATLNQLGSFIRHIVIQMVVGLTTHLNSTPTLFIFSYFSVSLLSLSSLLFYS